MPTADDHYVDHTRAMAPIMNATAGGIALLTIASVADDPRKLLLALVAHLVLIPFNIVINRVVLPRFGPRIEEVRALANIAITSPVYHLIGWPLPVWLWLPFCGLAFDQWGGKHALHVVAIMCVGQSAIALAGGVSPLYPITFSALAVACWMFATRRLHAIRHMFANSEAQRHALAQAHEELKAEIEARQRVELELRQAQKLEALGRLASGVAHEINTPMQFIGDSLFFLSEGVTELLAVHESCAAALNATPDARDAALRSARERASEVDVDYLAAELPSSIQLASEGVKRVSEIVRSMKQFAHHGADGIGSLDINQAIETTLTIAKHEYKLVADVVKDLGNVPPVICNIGEINQVLLNLIVNAAHAIQDAVKGSGTRGVIAIASRVVGHHVVISIADTGTGIPEPVRAKIFEPFFTTKEVGRGTGQGLAIARAVVERHHGQLTFTSAIGHGTTFEIHLPASVAKKRAA
jgi:signal transduction histidine kinase